MHTIFHITNQIDWEQAQNDGSYRADSLASEGFIHCSERYQVAETLNRIFHGQTGLIVLEIDPANLRSPLLYEESYQGQRFPHIYGPLNLDAVIQVHPLSPDLQGSFSI